MDATITGPNFRNPSNYEAPYAAFAPGDYVLRVTYYGAGDIMSNADLAADFARRQEREAQGLPLNGQLVRIDAADIAAARAGAADYLRAHGAIDGWLDEVIGANEARSLGRVTP